MLVTVGTMTPIHHVADVPGLHRSSGPYSPAVTAAGLCFVSCQLAIDPTTGVMVDGGFDAQAERALLNVDAALNAADTGWDRVVSTSVLLTDLDNGDLFNVHYRRRFDTADSFPARAMYQAAGLAPGALVGVAVIAATMS